MTTGVELENITPREISQAQEDKCLMFLLYMESTTFEFTDESGMVITRGQWRGKWRDNDQRYRMKLHKRNKFDFFSFEGCWPAQ